MMSINSTQVISCLNLDEAVNFARDIAQGDGLANRFMIDAAQKVMRERSVRMPMPKYGEVVAAEGPLQK